MTSKTVLTYPILVASLAKSRIVDRSGYDYFVHPLSDGIPDVESAVLQEAADGIIRHLRPYLADADKLVTAEAMGLPLVAAVSLATGIPFVIIRKRSYGLPGERALAQKTGYGGSTLYLNSVHAGERIVVVDDVISTGGTLRAVVGGLRDVGAAPLAVCSVFSKDPDLTALAAELGCPMSALVSCRVATGPTGKHVEILGTDLRA